MPARAPFDTHRSASPLRRCGSPSGRGAASAGALTSVLLIATTLVSAPLCAQTTGNAAVPLVGASTPAPTPGPITGGERVKWIVKSSIGPGTLTAGVFSAGWSTAWNVPHEYGTGWEGFGKRYGIRLVSVSIGNTVEGALGAAWGEDPRYSRAGSGPTSHRIGHALKMLVMAPGPDGRLRPSYARYAGMLSTNFISNQWRAESDRSSKDALVRTASGFIGRTAGNMFAEFGPDLWRKLAKRK